VQHLRDFGRFEMNKLDRGRQRDRILVAEEGVLYKIENQSQTSPGHLANHLEVSQFVVWRTLKEQGLGPCHI
jgi:hypothetical protein